VNSEKFLQFIANPNSVSKKQTEVLASVLEEFPYFQTARVLHLKGLKNQHSYKYNKALKKTAAFTTNRTVLFDFITKDTLDFETVSDNEQELLNDIDVVDSKVIDHLYESIIASEKNEDSLKAFAQLPNLDVIKNVSEESLVKESAKEIEKTKEVLEIGKPINFNKEDSFSFNEWLQLKSVLPIKREEIIVENKKELIKEEKRVAENKIIPEKEKEKIEKATTLIETFIKNKPKIKPIKGQEITDVSTESISENTNLMTETLARVYLEQKKYKKAIAAFKILSLKYPEKSSFFADRIKAIKFLEKHKS